MTPDEFEVQAHPIKDKDVMVLEIVGEIGTGNFDVIEKSMLDLFTDGHHRLIVDLKKVTYISSAGVGVFISALLEVRKKNGDIVLMSPNERVKTILSLLNLGELISIVDDLPAALARFNPPGNMQ